jgi:hypothetical protein
MREIIFPLFFIFFVSTNVYASPYPAAGSSALVSIDKGLFLLTKGFSVKAKSNLWNLQSPLFESEGTAEYRLEKIGSESAQLSLRSETLRSELRLESYAKRWMKDYSNYGFDILGTKQFQQSPKSRGLVIDLTHKKSNQQLRQVLFMQGKNVVVLTCKDLRKNFTATLEKCNEVGRSFQWAEISPQKSF